MSILFTFNSVSYGAIDFSSKAEISTLRAAAAALGQAGGEIAVELGRSGSLIRHGSVRRNPFLGGDHGDDGYELGYPFRDTSTPRAFADFKSSSSGKAVINTKVEKVEVEYDTTRRPENDIVWVKFDEISLTASKSAGSRIFIFDAHIVGPSNSYIEISDRSGNSVTVHISSDNRYKLHPMLYLGRKDWEKSLIKNLNPSTIVKILTMAQVPLESRCYGVWMDWVKQEFPNDKICREWAQAKGRQIAKSSSAGRVIRTDNIRTETGKDIAVPTISVSFGDVKLTADKEAPMNSIGSVTERVSHADIAIHRRGDRKSEYAMVLLVETTKGVLYPVLTIGRNEAASASGIIKDLTLSKITKILKMANLGPKSACCRGWMEYVKQQFPRSAIYAKWLKATGQKTVKSSSSGEGTVEPFIYKGKYEAHKLTAKGGSFINVVPALNAKIISFTAVIKGKPKEILYVLDDPNEPRGGITGLYFPWAGRLGKVFTYRGRRVDLSKYIGNKIRDDGKGNGLHGLLSFEPWRVLGTSFESDSSAIGLGYDAGGNPIFKEMFGEGASASLYRRYTSAPNKLITTSIVTNNGTEPFIFTTTEHTWFNAPDPASIDREKCQVLVPADKHYRTENGMPVGLEDAAGIYDLRALTSLGRTNYDDTYTVLRRDAAGNAVMYLVNPAQGTIIKTTQSKEYTHSVCFAPLARPNVSLEAQAGMADAFNHQGEEGSGLVELKPLETWQATFTIEVMELTEQALAEIATSASLAKAASAGETATVGGITFDVEDVNAASLLAREFGARATRHLIIGIKRMRQDARNIGRLALTEYNISTILHDSAVCAYIFFTDRVDSCLIFVTNKGKGPKVVPLLIRVTEERSIDIKLVTLTQETIGRLQALPNISQAATGTLELFGASSQFVERPAQYKQFKVTAAILAAA